MTRCGIWCYQLSKNFRSDKANTDHNVKYSHSKYQLSMSPSWMRDTGDTDKADTDHDIKHKPLKYPF